MLMAGVIELLLAGFSVLVLVNWWRASHGDLARNAYVGLRTESTLRNAQSWAAGNRAAARTAPLYLVFHGGLSAALFAAAGHGWRVVVCFVGGAGLLILIGLLIYSAVVGGRAARAVGGPDDHRSVRDPGH
jgi:hypothetical protein